MEKYNKGHGQPTSAQEQVHNTQNLQKKPIQQVFRPVKQQMFKNNNFL